MSYSPDAAAGKEECGWQSGKQRGGGRQEWATGGETVLCFVYCFREVRAGVAWRWQVRMSESPLSAVIAWGPINYVVRWAYVIESWVLALPNHRRC